MWGDRGRSGVCEKAPCCGAHAPRDELAVFGEIGRQHCVIDLGEEYGTTGQLAVEGS